MTYEEFKKKYEAKITNWILSLEIDTSEYEDCYFEPDINRDIGLSPDLNILGYIKKVEDQKEKVLKILKKDDAGEYIELDYGDFNHDRDLVDDFECNHFNEYVEQVIKELK